MKASNRYNKYIAQRPEPEAFKKLSRKQQKELSKHNMKTESDWVSNSILFAKDPEEEQKIVNEL